MQLPDNLRRERDRIEAVARGYGLDFFETRFEVLDYDQMNEIASFGGFPSRYPHWRFGMEYESMQKGYAYGLQKIYEMVINNDPCYAYLLECNDVVDQKLVMAHVYAHCDFFKNNLWFSKTNRKMIDEMANHSSRIRRYAERHGEDRVESFLDACLSIENLIDYHSPFIKRRGTGSAGPGAANDDEGASTKIRSKGYMDRYVNPASALEEERLRREEREKMLRRFPPEPEKDVLLFLLENAPMEEWERDILGMIREEAYYFAPQAQTKIMNEGWATYWHSKMMTEKIVDGSELIDYADHHSGTVAVQPGQLNPYKLGLEIFRDIEERWDHGRFGRAYDECAGLKEKAAWDLSLGLGREKIFEVRRIFNDISFVDTFLTPEFCEKHRLFSYRWNEKKGQYEIEDRSGKRVKEQILSMLTNFGQPYVAVEDANHRNRGELLLNHRHDGVDLRLDHARDTLRNLCTLWRRPVFLRTVVDGKTKLLSHDGTDFEEIEVDESAA
ncbi:MAG: SpoVR family protein [bacterium]